MKTVYLNVRVGLLKSTKDNMKKLCKKFNIGFGTLLNKKFGDEYYANIGMLRQWLNEERITDPNKMVTNEQIIAFLENYK